MEKIISIEDICKIIYSGKKIAVITGAGVSVASGIAPFRDSDGNYIIKDGEKKLHINYLREAPKEFYEFFITYFMKPNKGPNVTHVTLAELQEKGYVTCIVTQNIDGLHTDAGSKEVIEFHGSGRDFFCTNPGCRAKYDREQYCKSDTCPKCGSMIRPDVSLYGERARDFEEACARLADADYVLVLGASLIVADINKLLKVYMEHKFKMEKPYNFIIINKDPTWLDNCGRVCRDDLAEVFQKVQDYGREKGILGTGSIEESKQKIM